ncbi:MAG: hypothetical protein ACRD2G_20160, partial [Terriglobia bacterium]
MLASSPVRSPRDLRGSFRACYPVAAVLLFLLAALGFASHAHAQVDQLNRVHIQPPPPTPANVPPAVEGKTGLKARSGERYRVNVNLV